LEGYISKDIYIPYPIQNKIAKKDIPLSFLPTARSAVGLGITFSTFTPSIASFGHLAIWPFGHLAIWPFGHLAIWPFGHFIILTFQDRG
jgi:hypothetical protein